DRADEAGVGVGDLVGVGVVGPQHRAFVVGAGTGPLRHGPDVGVLAALRHGVVGLVGPAGAVVVVRPLGGLVVEQAVGMHAGRERRVVPEDDLDRVADLGVDRRPEDAEVLPLLRAGNERLERAVGVPAVDRFAVDVPDALVAVVEVGAGGGLEARPEQVPARRGVIPVDRIGGDVVRPR